jgi:hypothetical protein
VPADPRDNFEVLAEREHLMFGLVDPYGPLRECVEHHLRAEAPDTVVESIEAYDDPKWLTIARRDDEGSGTVTQFGFCVRAHVAVTAGYSREQISATLTLLIGGWDDPDHHRRGVHVDLHADADRGFSDAWFRQRFLAFRDENAG